MPTVATSPSTRIHSWSLVYRRFSGTISLFRSLVKGGFHGDRIHELAADHDLNGLARDGPGGREIAETDVLTESRGGPAAGDPSGGFAIEEHFVAIAADAAAAHLEADELAGNAGLLLLHEGVAADEIAFVELDDPIEAGFEGRDGSVDFVAVERHFGFEPECVARAEAARADAEFLAGAQDLVPNPLGFGGRDVELEAVLAGRAGAGDARGDAAGFTGGEPGVFDGGEIDRRQRLQRGACARALDGELRVAVGGELDGGREAVMCADVLEILFLIAGVDAEEEVIVRDLVDEDVVDEAAVLVEKAGVVGLAGFELVDCVGGEEIGEARGVRAADLDFAHVADVEYANAGADGVVLLDDAGVLHGHIPAAEIDHSGAQRAVHGIERRGAERRSCGHENSG